MGTGFFNLCKYSIIKVRGGYYKSDQSFLLLDTGILGSVPYCLVRVKGTQLRVSFSHKIDTILLP